MAGQDVGRLAGDGSRTRRRSTNRHPLHRLDEGRGGSRSTGQRLERMAKSERCLLNRSDEKSRLPMMDYMSCKASIASEWAEETLQ